jgi:hypothetical protein
MIIAMTYIKQNLIGIIGGFIFGTLGIFLLAVLSLALPFMEIISMPFLLPGRYLAAMIAGPSASTATVLLLYLLVGIFYAVIGMGIQIAIRAARGRSASSVNQ